MSRSRSFWRRWAFNEIVDIDRDGDVMMRRRRLIQTPLGGIYVHRIYRADSDPFLHDHPWNFATVILRGGYTELHCDLDGFTTPSTRSWGRGSVHRMRAECDTHRIVEVEPGTLTLVLIGRRRLDWGFYVPGGWVPHHQYRPGDYRDADNSVLNILGERE